MTPQPAEDEGQTARYLAMLARSGRIAEAVAGGLASSADAQAALHLARTLDAQGAAAEALRIAAHGMTFQTDRQRPILARWLRDRAAAAGDNARALEAASVVMATDPSLADYLALQAVADARWPLIRANLLAGLRIRLTLHARASAAIFLHEGMLDAAIAVAEANPHDSTLAEQVADAAMRQRPDRVIDLGRRQAEAIISRAQAKRYPQAARWLAQVRAASVATGRTAEWRSYLADLIARHSRKSSLAPLLNDLQTE